MGVFFGSISVRHDDRDFVLKSAKTAMKKRRCPALVGPALNGWVTIYPHEYGQDHRPAEALAKIARTDALQLIVHDDDVFMFNYFRNGIEIDCYTSSPGYFNDSMAAYETKCIGRPELFEHLIPQKAQAFTDLLRRDREFVCEGDRLRQIAALFGITNAATCYEYLKAEAVEGMLRSSDFNEVP